MSSVHIHVEDIPFKLPNKKKVIHWIKTVAKDRGFTIKDLNYIFCTDEYLLAINKDYLQHDYYTDIITFDHTEDKLSIEGDIFISTDRVMENATTVKTSFINELHRVMIHGLLHLVGINDKTTSEKAEMRKLEDHYLALREF